MNKRVFVYDVHNGIFYEDSLTMKTVGCNQFELEREDMKSDVFPVDALEAISIVTESGCRLTEPRMDKIISVCIDDSNASTFNIEPGEDYFLPTHLLFFPSDLGSNKLYTMDNFKREVAGFLSEADRQIKELSKMYIRIIANLSRSKTLIGLNEN